MNIFECLSDNPSFQRAVNEPVIDGESIPLEPETPQAEPEQVEPPRCRRPWSEVPLIEMVPAEYRPQVQEVLAEDAAKIQILETCKLGIIDCWEALERLGITHEY